MSRAGGHSGKNVYLELAIQSGPTTSKDVTWNARIMRFRIAIFSAVIVVGSLVPGPPLRDTRMGPPPDGLEARTEAASKARGDAAGWDQAAVQANTTAADMFTDLSPTLFGSLALETARALHLQ